MVDYNQTGSLRFLFLRFKEGEVMEFFIYGQLVRTLETPFIILILKKGGLNI